MCHRLQSLVPHSPLQCHPQGWLPALPDSLPSCYPAAASCTICLDWHLLPRPSKLDSSLEDTRLHCCPSTHQSSSKPAQEALRPAMQAVHSKRIPACPDQRLARSVIRLQGRCPSGALAEHALTSANPPPRKLFSSLPEIWLRGVGPDVSAMYPVRRIRCTPTAVYLPQVSHRGTLGSCDRLQT